MGHTCQRSTPLEVELLLAERKENRIEVFVVQSVLNKLSQVLLPSTVVAEAPGIEGEDPCIVPRVTPESPRQPLEFSDLLCCLCFLSLPSLEPDLCRPLWAPPASALEQLLCHSTFSLPPGRRLDP